MSRTRYSPFYFYSSFPFFRDGPRPGRNERPSLRRCLIGRQTRPGHHTPRAPPSHSSKCLKSPVALFKNHLDPHHRVPLAARHRLGQSQQRRLRGLVRHVHDDASIRAKEGRGEEHHVRDVLFRRRRRRRHSRDDDARQRSLHGRHVERVEQLDVSVWDRVDEFFRNRFTLRGFLWPIRCCEVVSPASEFRKADQSLEG